MTKDRAENLLEKTQMEKTFILMVMALQYFLLKRIKNKQFFLGVNIENRYYCI
jgi:hypothetical protein